MRKAGIIACGVILGTILGFSVVRAQTWHVYCDEGNNNTTGVIPAFHSTISVNNDNSIYVEELIDFITCGVPRHGIYRDIYLYSSENRKMEIEDISVTDLYGNAYQFTTYEENDDLRIKIGDPDVTFTTDKTYLIKYRATQAVAHLEDRDEIYWNVTGNDWIVPIQETSVNVFVPDGADIIEIACYSGERGSTDSCQVNQDIVSGLTYYKTDKILLPGDGLTIAAGFTKGIVAPYEDTIFDSPYLSWAIGILMPMLTLLLSLWYWHKHGRDPKGRGVIVPEYDVPDGLSPMEAAGIVLEKVNGKQIGAEIIYLATQGFLKITELEKKYVGLIKAKDYELTLLKDIQEAKNGFHRNLLFYLFNTPAPFSPMSFFKKEIPRSMDSTTVRLSDLRNTFYQYISPIVTLVLNSLVSKGYYKYLGKMKNGATRWVMIAFFAIWGPLFVGGLVGSLWFENQSVPIGLGIFLSVVIYGAVSHFSPAKTEKGVAAKEYLLGLKDYLRIAEKDRLEFHNAPDKKPEVFEKLLPFAMVLGVADVWAKEFEGIYRVAPSWYSGTTGTAFGAAAFSHSLSNFNSFTSSSLSSSPGGSGGGGSSGGGGGGGGGGGW